MIKREEINKQIAEEIIDKGYKLMYFSSQKEMYKVSTSLRAYLKKVGMFDDLLFGTKKHCEEQEYLLYAVKDKKYLPDEYFGNENYSWIIRNLTEPQYLNVSLFPEWALKYFSEIEKKCFEKIGKQIEIHLQEKSAKNKKYYIARLKIIEGEEKNYGELI